MIKETLQALVIEEIVLGSLFERQALENVIDKISIDAFTTPVNQSIFRAIRTLYTSSLGVDLASVSNQIEKNGDKKLFGNDSIPFRLTGLLDRIVNTINIEQHIHILKEFQIKRESIKSANQLIRDCYDPTKDVFEVIGAFRTNNDHLLHEALTKPETSQLEAVNEAFKQIEENALKAKNGLTGIPSLIDDLDSITGGWQNTDLIVLAARSAMGKTSLALTLTNNAAVSGYSVAFFSLEMAKNQILSKLFSINSQVPFENIRKGKMTSEDWSQLNFCMDDISQLPIVWDDAKMGITELIAKAKRIKRKYDTKLFVIDYLQHISSVAHSNTITRDREIGQWTQALKNLAKELNVPIIVLSQLSRNVENRADKRPMLSDLRESGSIEQDADMVLFLYRPEYYKIETDILGNSTDGRAEIIIAKHRNGRCDTVSAIFDKNTTGFTSITEEFYNNI
ncbi:MULTISPECIES: replicative DNA helicase [Sphingobacterium]|uniref:Replicative DNA helicase n=1 Tax=Sphingobacterium tenebrionis TaxID=3111775 RepID=A0ABU8I4A1_9SPHI|nr:replicative DNA helicase [Sphingobacterium sp. CZ-2]QBR11473.1 replicative DNA helicase [Sphingobacterium sp. CZ-2]